MKREEHGLIVFFRLEDDVFHFYSTYARGTESLTDAYSLLDTTPYGRQQHLEVATWMASEADLWIGGDHSDYCVACLVSVQQK